MSPILEDSDIPPNQTPPRERFEKFQTLVV